MIGNQVILPHNLDNADGNERNFVVMTHNFDFGAFARDGDPMGKTVLRRGSNPARLIEGVTYILSAPRFSPYRLGSLPLLDLVIGTVCFRNNVSRA
jgi:hypothetical protein